MTSDPDMLMTDRLAKKGFFRDNLEVVCVSILLILFFKTFVGQQFTIPSASMRNTLMIGDHLLANKFIYGVSQWSWEERFFPMRSVRRGDIVVFRYPFDRSIDYVKRCIGLPGDRIEIRNKHLYVNKRLITGGWEYHINSYGELFGGPWISSDICENKKGSQAFGCSANDITNAYIRDNMSSVIIPSGCIFVMGDNRENSSDSRYWGFVPIDHLRGRPFIIWWSYREAGNDYTNAKIPTNLQDILWSFIDAGFHFFQRTRWGRVGYMPR